ncbi:arylamine N-acetyltransferase family protein [Laceyella putida]|uniref:Arylamine N-acetyltransferase n=1 Tax=Laceyella putida TaxID=110101 RepID=A0ABW2RP26_9BACL
MEAHAYLERIGVGKAGLPIDASGLALLQAQHLLTVPFENLDIHWGCPIRLELSQLYRKVVINRRGGFCFELNGLFAWLLQELGFRVTLLAASVFKPDGTLPPRPDHLTLLVSLDQPYLVDVGFGDSFRQPLPLTGEERRDVSGTYRIVKQEEGRFLLQHKGEGGWKAKFLFTLAPRVLSDFTEVCEELQTSPDSIFKQKRICTIATVNGRVTLSDECLAVTEEGIKRKKLLTSERERTQLLYRHFGLVCPNDEKNDKTGS